MRRIDHAKLTLLLLVLYFAASQAGPVDRPEDAHVPSSSARSRYRGKALADLPLHERAKALVAIGATEDAKELDPHVLDSPFEKIGRAVGHGAASVARAVAWLLSGGKIEFPRGRTPSGVKGEEKPGEGRTVTRKPKAYESGDVVLGYVKDEKSGEISPAADIPVDPSILDKHLLIRINRFYIQEYPGRPPYHIYLYIDRIKPLDLTEEKPSAEKPSAEKPTPLVGFVAQAEQAPVNKLRGNALFSLNKVPQEGVDTYLRIDQVTEGFFRKLFKKFIGFAAVASDEVVKAGGLVPARWHSKEANQMIQDLNKWMKEQHTRPILDTSISLAVSGPGRLERLREGLYVVVQADPETFKWEGIKYAQNNGSVVSGHGEVSFNYLILGIQAIPPSNQQTTSNPGR